jgi:hypothetical protein
MKQERQCGLVGILSLWILTPFADAVPPPAPTRAELVNHSDVIAIVTVTNVTGRTYRDNGEQLRGFAHVERVLKGAASGRVVLAYNEPSISISCRPPSLFEGRFLVFLKKRGDVFWRTDDWYGQHRIATNHVRWELQHPQELSAAIREIERIAKRATD